MIFSVALYHMGEGPLPAATYTMNAESVWHAVELDETFIKVAATRQQSLILRATAAELRAESNKLRVIAARLASHSARLRTNGSSAPILREEA